MLNFYQIKETMLWISTDDAWSGTCWCLVHFWFRIRFFTEFAKQYHNLIIPGTHAVHVDYTRKIRISARFTFITAGLLGIIKVIAYKSCCDLRIKKIVKQNYIDIYIIIFASFLNWLLLKIVIKSSRNSWILKCPTGPNQIKSQIIFHQKVHCRTLLEVVWAF